MATHADKFALVRSVYYAGVAVHDAGHQMMQTGRLFQAGTESPHVGSVLGYLKGPKGDIPPHVLLPRPIGNTGGNMPHGQIGGLPRQGVRPVRARRGSRGSELQGARPAAAGLPDGDPCRPASQPARPRSTAPCRSFEASPDARLLNSSFDQAYTLISSSKARAAFDLSKEPDALKDKYGRNRFGMSCLLARRLIEAGVRFVTVNMFETVFNEITWDIHGSAPFSPIQAYRDLLGPMFDNAYASLLEDLTSRGLLDNTLVVAMGEFGRTPKINPAGGRDHWPQCWTMSMAGGGVKGGQVIGASDETRRLSEGSPGARRGRWPRRCCTASASRSTRNCRARRGGRCPSSIAESSRSRNCSKDE